MKNAYGGYLIVIIVFTFLILFTGYICLSINQAKSFNIKNEIIKGVEIYGISENGDGKTGFSSYVAEVLKENGYTNSGKCGNATSSGTMYGYSRNGSKVTNTNDDVAFCIEYIPVSGSVLNGYYCKVKTFYKLDIPFVGDLFTREATGETKTIYGK